MAIPDQELADVLRALLRLTTGFYVGFAEMLEIGQTATLEMTGTQASNTAGMAGNHSSTRQWRSTRAHRPQAATRLGEIE